MLNSSVVLQYIKSNLAFPFMHLEKGDEEILDFIKEFTLKEFSHYFPDVKYMGMNLQNCGIKVSGRRNEYYIEEPEGMEILNVIELYFPMGDWIALGHPPIGAFSQGELRTFILDVSVAGMIKQFSSWDYTYEFFHPNILRISPEPKNKGYIAIEYERMQPSDFRGIRNDIRHLFLELALADIMIMLGRIRKRYGGNLRTPFGEIPLESDILDEGKEKKREVIEKLTLGSHPNIIIEFG